MELSKTHETSYEVMTHESPGISALTGDNSIISIKRKNKIKEKKKKTKPQRSALDIKEQLLLSLAGAILWLELVFPELSSNTALPVPCFPQAPRCPCVQGSIRLNHSDFPMSVVLCFP